MTTLAEIQSKILAQPGISAIVSNPDRDDAHIGWPADKECMLNKIYVIKEVVLTYGNPNKPYAVIPDGIGRRFAFAFSWLAPILRR